MQEKISVIVPIYNGEKYIPQMIDSIRNQSYKNFEVLLVEDHSTDNSKKLLETVCNEDDRFKLLEPRDKRGTAVRGQEWALPYCSGKYHFFMSQDDFMDNDLFMKCVEKIEVQGADVVIPNCILFQKGDNNSRLGNYPIDNDYNKILDSRTAFELSMQWNIHGFTMERMDLFKKVGLKAEYYNSDEYWKRILFLESSKIMFADTNFYYRQNNPDAITKKIKYIHVDVVKTDFLLCKRMLKEKYPKKVCKGHLKRITINYVRWYYHAIRHGFWYKKKCYVLRILFSMLFPLIGEWMRLIRMR